MAGFVLGLSLRRRLSSLFRLRPGQLQCSRLPCGRPHPAYDLSETGVHHLVEVLRCQDVYVVAESLCLRKFRKVIKHLLKQFGNVEPFGVNWVGGNSVELFDGQASGVVLQQVIDERDYLLGVLGVFGHEPTRPHSGRGRDAGALYRREREESNFKFLDSLDDLRHEPRACGVHGGLTGIEQSVSTVVGEGVWALRVVSVLHEVPEEEVDGLLDLGGIPPTVSIENVIQPFPTKHVAGPYAEHMTCGVLFPVSKGERDLSASLELVRDLS